MVTSLVLEAARAATLPLERFSLTTPPPQHDRYRPKAAGNCRVAPSLRLERRTDRTRRVLRIDVTDRTPQRARTARGAGGAVFCGVRLVSVEAFPAAQLRGPCRSFWRPFAPDCAWCRKFGGHPAHRSRAVRWKIQRVATGRCQSFASAILSATVAVFQR